MLVEAYDILRGRGYEVDEGIAEEMLVRPDLMTVSHDLYILKSHTELSLSLAGVLYSQGARLLNPFPSCHLTQNKIVVSRLLEIADVPGPALVGDGRPGALAVARRRDDAYHQAASRAPWRGH